MIIEDDTLCKIYGGGWKTCVVGIGMLLTLLVGIADGYLRPLKCN